MKALCIPALALAVTLGGACSSAEKASSSKSSSGGGSPAGGVSASSTGASTGGSVADGGGGSVGTGGDAGTRGAGGATPGDAASDAPVGPPSAACVDEVRAASCTTIAAQIAAAVASTTGTVTVSVPPCLNEHGAAIPYRELVRIPGTKSAAPLDRPIVLSAQPGAEIRGSDIWTQWSPPGDGGVSTAWTSSNDVPVFGPGNGACLDEAGNTCSQAPAADGGPAPAQCFRCTWVEQVFVDGVARRHVATCTDGTSTTACGGLPALDGFTFALDGDRHVLLSSAGGFDPTQHCIEVSTRPHWVIADSPTANSVTVEGFTMLHAATGANDGAIHNGVAANKVEGGGQSVADDANVAHYGNWTVQNNVLSLSHSAGISLSGSIVVTDAGAPDGSADWTTGVSLVIAGNTVTACGDLGVHSSATEAIQVTKNVFTRNGGLPINGVVDPGFDPGWGSGGFKAAQQHRMVVQGNTSSNNVGAGLWCDINCYDTTYEGNTTNDNTASGIFYEIGDTALIRGNTAKGNGATSSCCSGTCAANSGCAFFAGAQILVSASPNVVVTGNTVAGAMGLGVLQQYRTDSCAASCPPYHPSCCEPGPCSSTTPYHQAHDVSFTANDVTETVMSPASGVTAGLSTDICHGNGTCTANTENAGAACDPSYFYGVTVAPHIVFSGNRYHVQSCSSTDWGWDHDNLSWSGWNDAGQDVGDAGCGP